MRRIFAKTTAILFVLSMAINGWSDTLTMRDGTRVTGTFAGATSKTVSLKDSRGVVHRYSTKNIQLLEFSAPTQGPNSGFGSRNRSTSAYPVHEVVPSGTELVIRTNELIDSKTASQDQNFSAQFDRDVVGRSGRVVIPKGSEAQLVIRSVSSGGVTGGSDLVLDVQSVTVNGRRYQVSTADLERRNDNGIGKNKRTAEMIGGGAALGAIIGAVVGHGKGAAIGAAAGGAGGAGAQVLLKGKSVSVPAETILTFTLNQSVTI